MLRVGPVTDTAQRVMIEWPNGALAMAGTYNRLPKTAPSLCQLSWPKGRCATLF